MNNYVTKVHALTDALAFASDKITDKNIIDFVIEGLNSEYCTFIAYVDSQPNMIYEEPNCSYYSCLTFFFCYKL